MNSQISSHRRPALGALLMVLSASAVLAEVNSVAFKGTFDASDKGVVQYPTLLLNGGGTGTASHLGRFTFTYTTTVNLTNGLSSGVIQLVAANGDVINGVSVGQGLPTGTPNLTDVMQLVTITGGTGRFQGATGGFTSDALLVDDPNTGIGLSSGSLTGTISTPGSTK